MQYQEIEWKEFFIEDVAEIISGHDIYEGERVKGKTPYISSTSLNNGIGYFVSNINNTLEANCISVSRNGSVGYAFYHPYKALFSNDCRKLRIKRKSKYIALFIATQISKQKDKYGYGYKMGTGRLSRQKIFLPADSSGCPNWDFMEKYMQEKEKNILAKYKAYIGLNELIAERNIIPLHDKPWREFSINNIFKIKPGKRLTKAQMRNGQIPFVGASDSNNGVTAFIANINQSLDNNVLGVNYNGSVVESFYHPYTCIFSDDVKRFLLKDKGNKYIYLFLKSAIIKQKEKYQYGYKFNERRMNNQKIMLPVTESGDPDYEYMESYMKAIEARQVQRYLEYYNKLMVSFST